MQFTLITATYGRSDVLERMLWRLAEQTLRSFDLVLIDQNSDDRVRQILLSLPTWMRVKYLFSSPPGLVPALNMGLRSQLSDVVGFPDDDCEYPPDLLENLARLFMQQPDWDGITVPTKDRDGKSTIARWDTQPGRLKASNVGMRGCSTSVFYKASVCRQIGEFENPIPDDPVAPGFDMDYLHRIVKAGFNIQFQPQLHVRHPQTLPTGDATAEVLRKRYNYGFGEGLIARRYSLPAWYLGGIVLFPLGRSVKCATLGPRRETSQQWQTFRGRLAGWLAGKP